MARGIALDSDGNAHITGETTSADFPQRNWIFYTYKGEQDGFVAKFSPGQGDKGLVYSTYLGGEGSKTGYGIALDKDNKTYVAGGITISGPEPFSFSNQAFVTKLSDLNNVPAVVYTKTLANGTAYGIAVDKSGNAYITGGTSSQFFPTQNPIFPYQAGMEAFVSKINPAGSDLVYSTFLPGQLSERGNAIAVDTIGCAYVTGFTDSGNFPIKNGKPWNSFDDIFVTKLNPAGSALVYSTCIGGLSSEWGNGIALDVFGNVYVTGYTGSTDFPLKNPLYSIFGGAVDAVVLKLRSVDNGPAIDLLLLTN